MAIQRKILINRPYGQANAQYNIDTETDKPTGVLEGSVADKDMELYTTVEDRFIPSDASGSALQTGRLWFWKGVKLEFTNISTRIYGSDWWSYPESDKGHYRDSGFAVYVYDGATPEG